MTDRKELETALRDGAAGPTPEPDAAFLDALERRLTTVAPSGVVVPFARRARRVSAGVVVAATLTFAGAAAAAGIAVARPFQNDPPATAPPTPSTEATSTSAATATTATVAATSSTPAAPPSTNPPATIPPTIPATVPATVSATTAPVTAPVTVPATAPPTTVAPSTTELHTAATMTLHCAVNAAAVRCDWSAGPDGTVRYAVLRSQPGTGPGRVYFVDVGVTTWTDPLAAPGTVATYLVHAFDAQDHSLAHSPGVAVTCC